MNVRPAIEAMEKNTEDDGLWFKDAIVYQLHVKAFQDSNDDGVGDFIGLTQRLDYLRDLGVTTLWLLPFYPSPGRDDGYDISDYGDINPQFGTMKDFRRFMHEAKRRDLRVITELVVNHTSDQHPWFKRAKRSGRHTSARNWYVWSDNDHKYSGTRIIFTDTEKSNWTWDDEAGAFYWHRFFSHQPDLNFDNPRVVRAVLQVMKRWLDAGVDGFRLDAVPYLCEREGTNNENLPETHAVLKRLRAELDAYAPNKVLLAEANQWPEDVQAYFGEGDECHMAYHFPLMPRIYMAIAQEDRFPITDIMRQTPEIPPNCQWAMFLRNHDELTLEMVTDAERDYLWSTYAADPRARINLGIRRRLAPLMDNDRRKIELMNSILMSMPGTPIIYYGDEIGMGDNIYLGDRNGVRTPMQWTPDRNGGFSRADPAKLFLPCIMDPVYGYSALNVEAQTRSLSSLLSWTKRTIGVRKSTRVFGRGTLTFIRPENRAVLAYVRQLGEEAILCVANMSRSAQAVELDMSAWEGRIPQEMLGRTRFPRIGELPYLVTLPPYGFFWFSLLKEPGQMPEKVLPREITTLVLGPEWEDSISKWTRRTFETDVLPGFMPDRRWFGDKASRHVSFKVSVAIRIEQAENRFGAVIADVKGTHGTSRYFLPVTVRWTRYTDVDRAPASVLCAVRRGSREGALLDATAEPEFIATVLVKIHAGETIGSDTARIEFRPTTPFTAEPLPQVEHVTAIAREQSNSSVIVDNKYVVKVLRRITAGIHPDIEVGRFLADVAHFQNAPQLLGSVELVEGENRSALAVVHAFVENQGDAWGVTAATLDRLVEEHRLLTTETPLESLENASMLQRIRQIGRRTAEMHVALACRDDIPAFAPEPISADDVTRWSETMVERTRGAFGLLDRLRRELPERTAVLAQRLHDNRDAILRYIGNIKGTSIDGLKIRHHGDFHLGQVLIAKDDAYILDFEGEPRRSLDERRSKAPPARDVAGLLRSIDYAASSALDRAGDITAEERAGLAMGIRDWSGRMTDAYWESYREALGEGARLWPTDAAQTQYLLDVFLLEKALYEIEYELANRPAWSHIPIEASLRIFEQRGVIGP
ncbi:MAG TPA: maltose alpha-D-glucosyltransferase [Pseudolabrys sp.]|jgi:maltose alpha-D-glucosyltransferase/alpha-amylase|nr:maltose alpha-D-glucosyltransferase [Pseudolabrys sp.]